MTKDVHVFLSDEDAEALSDRAKSEVRSVTNMAYALILRGLEDQRPVTVAAPRRGRPPKAAQPETPAPSADVAAPHPWSSYDGI